MPQPPPVCEWSEIQRATAATDNSKGAAETVFGTVTEGSSPSCCSSGCIAQGLNLLEQVESCIIALWDPQKIDGYQIQTVQVLRDCESTLVKLRKLMSWLHATGLNADDISTQDVHAQLAFEAEVSCTKDSEFKFSKVSRDSAVSQAKKVSQKSAAVSRDSIGGILSTPLEVSRINKVSQKDPHLLFNEAEALQNMPRSFGGQALRHTKGLSLTVKPMISEIRFPDSVNGQDVLSRCPHIYTLYNGVVIIALMVVFTLGLFTCWIAAVTAYKYTAESDTHLFVSGKAQAFLNSSGGQKIQAICTVIHGVLLSAGIIANLDAAMSWSYPVVWFIWSENRCKLVGMFGSGLMYSVSAIVLVGSPSHVLWMCGRMFLVTTLSFYDASICTFKMRFTDKLFKKNYGAHGTSTRCKPVRVLLICAMLSYGVGDFLRHFLVVSQKEVVLVDMGIYHPATLKTMKITMNGIADALFVYSTSLACLTVGEYIEVAWSKRADGNELCHVKVGMYMKCKNFVKPFSETVSSCETTLRNTSSKVNFQTGSPDLQALQSVGHELSPWALDQRRAALLEQRGTIGSGFRSIDWDFPLDVTIINHAPKAATPVDIVWL